MNTTSSFGPEDIMLHDDAQWTMGRRVEGRYCLWYGPCHILGCMDFIIHHDEDSLSAALMSLATRRADRYYRPPPPSSFDEIAWHQLETIGI